ncbi:MAG: DEAD/DEAH box helicase [Candidatus Aminicenantales bacterium]
MTTNSQNSGSNNRSTAFFLLNEQIQRWIWQAGWTELRDIQEESIPLIIEGVQDVIISASTASGKTEAVFFPILTQMLAVRTDKPLAIYVSPLKALINDQWGRLDQLCEMLDIPVIPWHGDISQTKKKRFLKTPYGCLLITPESLEGLLIRYGHSLSSIFSTLRYFVIDELHAFIDTERGKQLQSIMNRIEVALNRRFPRIGLSATLGEMKLAADYLRPREGDSVRIITSKESGPELKLIIKGYYDRTLPQPDMKAETARSLENVDKTKEEPSNGTKDIAEDLFAALRGHNNLVFPNSRTKVELYADLLRQACEKRGIPNEFWPHHGSLSKDIREETERALKAGQNPATAIATTTLELGIDIGAVRSIAQIGPAPSVTSLRQRLGRSGRRRGEPAILRCYCLEAETSSENSISDQLREGLIQTIAQLSLLLKGWYEPPRTSNLHLSTLIQQLLSLIAQRGGITAIKAWGVLCRSGVFSGLAQKKFAELLRSLGEKEILSQEKNGLLLLGPQGERLVNHFSFLAAFVVQEEFRVVNKGRLLGTLPLSRPIEKGGYLIFAGRRWRVLSCRPDDRIIEVDPAEGGKIPIFDGMGGKVHDRIRKEMQSILSGNTSFPFLDKIAARQVEEARSAYSQLGLKQSMFFKSSGHIRIFSWLGDWANDALVLILAEHGLVVESEGLNIIIRNLEYQDVLKAFKDIGRTPQPTGDKLAARVQNRLKEKWDYLLTERLLNEAYASRELDIDTAMQFINRVNSEKQFSNR